MNRERIGLLLIGILCVGAAQAADSWPQWGGPSRDFVVEARELSSSWGEDGPPTLWARSLGGGFASIVGDGKRLYAAYRDGDEEILAALDPSNGETLWEYRYAAPVEAGQSLSLQYGKGPNGTPLLVDGKLISLGFTGKLVCLAAANGKELWSHDMGPELDISIPYFGHATSPLAVGKNVVVVAGGVRAFDMVSGELVWENTDHSGSYGSPRLVGEGRKQQLVTPVEAHLAGFDPASGKTLWAAEHRNQWGTILTSPVLDDSGRVFISAHGPGSILVDPRAKSDDARTLWKSGDTQISHSNAVRHGKWVFSSTGDKASFVTATSLEDGTQAWKERGFARANLIRAGDTFVLLDFDGALAMVELDESGMKVLTKATINDAPTWTPPTLIGDVLYVRDESRVMALDLSVR